MVPEIALFGLDTSQVGRVLVTLRESDGQTMSLLFRIYDGKPSCLLEDSAILSSDMGPWDELGLGTYHQRVVKDKPRLDREETWMTARASQVQIRSHSCTVITLCSKFVRSEVVRQYG
jgi:hypothetical protein